MEVLKGNGHMLPEIIRTVIPRCHQDIVFSLAEMLLHLHMDAFDQSLLTHGLYDPAGSKYGDPAKNAKPGLSQNVGEAAINPVPRAMILREAEEAAQEYDYEGGLKLTVSVPQGEEIAKKTFNPRLGILGGIPLVVSGSSPASFCTAQET